MWSTSRRLKGKSLLPSLYPKSLSQATAILFAATGLAFSAPVTAQVVVENSQAGYVGTSTGNWSGGGAGVVGLPDGSCANMGAQSKLNYISNFGFSVPAGATITGIAALSKYGSANPEVVTFTLTEDVGLVPPLGVLGSIQNVNIPGGGGGSCASTGPGQYPATLNNNLADWGNPVLTPAIVNAASFGLALTTASKGTIKFDSVCLQIAYTTTTGPAVTEQCLQAPPAGANLQVIKTVVGAPPNSDWDFVWQDVGGVTSTPFTLAAAGASQGFTDITIGQHIVGEVVKPGYTVSAECTVNEVPIEDLLPDNPADVAFVIADGQNVVCTFINTLNSTTYTVAKDFSDDAADVVGVSLSCTSGTVSPLGVQNLSEGSPVDFTVTGAVGTPNCTATESNIPAGYTSDTSACVDDPLGSGGCTITNTLNSANFTVAKDFSDDAADVVGVTLSCDTGTVSPAGVQNLSEAASVQFTVNGYTGDPNCTAVESNIPAGYTSSAAACTAVALSTGTCTITNTLNSANFTVAKDFSDDAADVVGVTLSCDTGTVSPAGVQNLSEAASVQFTVTGHTGNPNCTAVESNIPAGYTSDATACTAVALSAGTCTITNTVNTGTFTVRKIFTDDSDASVEVTATCSAPATVTNNPQQASGAASAIFNVDYVVPGVTTCRATEVVPEGYEVDDTDCQDDDPINGGCTLTNSPAGAMVQVTKTFTDANPAEVTVRLTCNAGDDHIRDFPLSDGEVVLFNVKNYSPTVDCWVQEVTDGTTGYTASYLAGGDGDATAIRSEADGCYYDEIESGNFECDLTNTPAPVEIEVTKEWIGDLDLIEANASLEASADYTCYNVLDGPAGAPGQVNGTIYFAGEEDTEIIIVYPWWGADAQNPSYCTVVENQVYSIVEADDSDCAMVVVELGDEDIECTITNTLFFEGIPTMSRTGLILLVLTMLGVGMVGLRRFV